MELLTEPADADDADDATDMESAETDPVSSNVSTCSVGCPELLYLLL